MQIFNYSQLFKRNNWFYIGIALKEKDIKKKNLKKKEIIKLISSKAWILLLCIKTNIPESISIYTYRNAYKKINFNINLALYLNIYTDHRKNGLN